jgi:hypothetical protein
MKQKYETAIKKQRYENRKKSQEQRHKQNKGYEK